MKTSSGSRWQAHDTDTRLIHSGACKRGRSGGKKIKRETCFRHLPIEILEIARGERVGSGTRNPTLSEISITDRGSLIDNRSVMMGDKSGENS